MNELALFTGAGGGLLGGQLLGWRTRCAVEINPYCRNVLLARQRDGVLPVFPIWDDVRTFDGRPWQGHIDVISGGFPCQDISQAGKKTGINGKSSGLWTEMARIIRQVRPRFVFVENSAMLTARGLGRVLGDMAEIRYDAAWGVFGADDAGAPHQRKRIWILAHTSGSRYPRILHEYLQRCTEAANLGSHGQVRSMANAPCERCREAGQHQHERSAQWSCGCRTEVSNTDRTYEQGVQQPCGLQTQLPNAHFERWWQVEPTVGRVVNGVADWVDRLRAIGNGQVPAVAALAWNELYRRIQE